MSLSVNQARDELIEQIGTKLPLTTEIVSDVRSMALKAESERREDSETYFKCPRCYGHHSVRENFDNLCDSCVRTILTHFPEHPSVPFIKAAGKAQYEKYTVKV